MQRDRRFSGLTRWCCSVALVSALSGVGAGCGASPEDDTGTNAGESAVTAPASVLRVLGRGTWRPEGVPASTLNAWVDVRVANVRFEKRVLVEVLARYEGGAVLRTLHPARYKSAADASGERWGTDAIQLFPAAGPGGARLSGPVIFRVRLQHDLNGDGRDEMVTTAWLALHGDGAVRAPGADDPWSSALTSPTRPVAGAAEASPESYFAPFDDPGVSVLREIDRVIEAKRADPGGRHTIHAAVFNINDPEIVARLIAAHRAGVEVRLVTEASKFRPESTWQTGDDALAAAGVPQVGVGRGGRGAMHLKYAIFDGARVATGSFNWETGSRRENHENMVLTRRPAVVAAYARHFQALAGGVLANAVPDDAVATVRFGPTASLSSEVGRLIDGARRTLHIAMFTAKDYEYEDGGGRASLFRKLVEARRRGVAVTLLTDQGVAEGQEYFGRTDPDDQTDEWLEANGVHVVLVDNPFGQYASMHHKLMVVDGEVALTGAFNWYYDAAFLNDEDVVVWRDRALAARFTGEITDLLRRYDPQFDPSAWPQVRVDFSVRHDGTTWGDRVRMVGDHASLGAWRPSQGVALDGSRFPTWRATLILPAGVRLAYKFAVLSAAGGVAWEQGDNRRFQIPTGVTTAERDDGAFWR